ncbi:MAG: cadmium-translocating P-type ATPase, partial [Clostridia bacterium]|nr:cadmium-translocating P-type ATPase [Clostridia bacterium]
FPEAVFVMLFFKIGEIFEEIADKKSKKSLDDLLKIRPDKAKVFENGVETERYAKDVVVGDTVIVGIGERIPLDGVILEGRTEIDTSPVTGESAPRVFGVSDQVYSGTVNLTSPLKIRVTATADGSTASKIIELVKNANEKKAKTERFITKFARIYTPAVIALAFVIAVVVPLITGGWRAHIYSALTFLVVSCPCALVISVPLSFFGAIGCASKKGILVKGADSLETVSDIDTLLLDKTGTLTKGSFEVTAIHPKQVSEDDILKLAAAVEEYSSHPIARSIVSHYNGVNNYFVEDVQNISGMGVGAVVEGKRVLIGNDKLMQKFNIGYKECSHKGTIVHIALDRVYLGHIVISDAVKDESGKAIDELKALTIEPIMLTGDNGDVAKEIAEKLGIGRYEHSLLPENKVGRVEKLLGENKKVAFVGDGINDAPALARANVGIAMGGLGSDAAIETADIVIMDDNIDKIPLIIKIARRAKLIAKQNIIFSIAVKLCVLILSALSIPKIMWFAAFSDVGVLVLAVLNAMRTMKIKGEDHAGQKL